MEIYQRKSINDELNKYCHCAKDNDFIEITEWVNGEGFDVVIFNKVTGIKQIQLTHGEIEAINYLTKALEIEEIK